MSKVANNPSDVKNSSVAELLLLRAEDAAKLCRITERTFRNWDSAGMIPQPVRIGRCVFWRPKELQAWIDAGCPKRSDWESR